MKPPVWLLCLLMLLAYLIAPAQNAEKTALNLSPLEVRAVAPGSWLRGGAASIRLIVTNHQTGKPVSAKIHITTEWAGDASRHVATGEIFTGSIGSQGTLNASFNAPGTEAGPYKLNIEVKTAIGDDKLSLPVILKESMQLMLTTDKPIYQPSQTIHIRALALDSASRQAISGQPCTFEVEDARGNKVFKSKQTLSTFGVGSVDFVLADEVNMGVFIIRAILPIGQQEKKVRVEQYVLPKFKVTANTDKNWYLPGEIMHGTINAKYFFGKPVQNGDIQVTINTVDVAVTQLKELIGKTDNQGNWKFDYELPRSFVGQPLEQGKAVIGLDVTLKDTADHKQETHITRPVVKDFINVTPVLESSTPVKGIENRVYISVATPDGAPLKNAAILASLLDAKPVPGEKPDQQAKTLITDALGIATYTYIQKADHPLQLTLDIKDTAGHAIQKLIPLAAPNGTGGLILRVDRPLARVGEIINLDVLTSSNGGTVFVDVIRNKQTVLTISNPIERGKSHITMPVTADMTGTLEFHAYKILPDENIIRDTRVAVVSPAGDLKVKVTTDHAMYRPGEEAILRFQVTDQANRPVVAALGLAMVDESVFALSELQPGLEKIYFTLEKELMEPKYEIHGLTPTGLMLPTGATLDVLRRDDSRQRAATMLFAGAPKSDNFAFAQNTWQTRWMAVMPQVVTEMQKTVQKLLDSIKKYKEINKDPLLSSNVLSVLLKNKLIDKVDTQDAWGTEYLVNNNGALDLSQISISSAGPDRKWKTSDDIVQVFTWGMQSNRFGGGRGGIRLRGMAGARMLNNDKDLGVMQEDMFFKADAPMNAALPAGAMAFGDSSAASPAPGSAGSPAPRVREYFPETMYWNPSLITGSDGQAETRIPMADSITTWRMSMMANTANGALGSSEAPIKCFQDFFADIDLPVALTQGDFIKIPVAVYNYMPGKQDVTLTMDESPWFTLTGSAKQSISINAGEVKVVYFPMTVKSIGHHALKITAIGTKLSDAIRRYIDVLPNGKKNETVINDRLEKNSEKTVVIPNTSLENATSLWVKFYPGTFSQVVEGLDGILRMPNGCFEQTSSTTYPNILVLDYLKATKKINPELQMKAEGYINVGYQRLVTFETKSGGFSWFGDEPAHQILTAYGLLEFSDMAKVHEVDPALISRTGTWLAGKQLPDGSWEEKNQGIAEGIINRQTGALRSTAYVAWALTEAGYQGPQVALGVAYVKAHIDEAKDPYTLAVILNLLAKTEKDGEVTAKVAQKLIDSAKTDEMSAWWEGGPQTFTGATAESADLETTGLAAYGLSKWGHNAGFTTKVLTRLVQSKDSFGTWSSTQGTVWSMKALLYAGKEGAGSGKGKVSILANGSKAGEIILTADNSDVMQQINLAEFVRNGDNKITLSYDGGGSLLYQIAGRYYTPWPEKNFPVANVPLLAINVSYDKTRLAQDDVATVTVKIKNNTGLIANMPLIDLGVPPGFTVDPHMLYDAVDKKEISKFTLAARQIIVYLEKLGPGEEKTLSYQIRAKYPIKALTPLSKVYPYYNPEQVAVSLPQTIEVQ